MCSPWESVEFLNIMAVGVPDDKCAKCLPDCSTTLYEPMITTVPFRGCDETNFGVSRFCNADNAQLPNPTMFARQVVNEYLARSATLPPFVKDRDRFYETPFPPKIFRSGFYLGTAG
jgi:hypothetical protein